MVVFLSFSLGRDWRKIPCLLFTDYSVFSLSTLRCNTSILPKISPKIFDDESYSTVVDGLFLTIVFEGAVWFFVVLMVIGVVVPYLLLGGWVRGIIYMLVVGSSFFVEDIFISYFPVNLRLIPNSAVYLFFVAVLIFSNALLFDWIYDVSTDRNKVCDGCASIIEVDASFCTNCGFLQR